VAGSFRQSWSFGQSFSSGSSEEKTRGRGESPEDKSKKDFVSRLCIAGASVTAAIAIAINIETVVAGEAHPLMANIRLGAMAVLIILALLYERTWGLTRTFKLMFPSGMLCVGVFIAVTSRPLDSWHLFGVLMLDFVAVMQSDEDELALQALSIALFLGYVVYICFHTFSVNGTGPQIHPIKYDDDYHWGSQLVCNIVPVALNFLLIMSYARDLRRETKRARTSVELASEVAKALNNFDLEAAQGLLRTDSEDEELPICKQLRQLIHSLRVYRPFLPNYLFPQNVGNDSDPTGGAISKAMWGKPTCWDHAASAAMRLRDPEYSLNDFHSDVEAAFPELKLYGEGSVCSSGRTCTEEYQRTLGALYSIYCIARLDIDGKEIFSFGVDPQGKPLAADLLAACGSDPADRRHVFYRLMDWDRMLELFVRAGLLLKRQGLRNSDRSMATTYSTAFTATSRAMSGVGKTSTSMSEAGVLVVPATMGSVVSERALTVRSNASHVGPGRTRMYVDVERMTAFLALTAVHDVMKNTALLPTVHERHAPYEGIADGDRIHDHDLGLRYIMEHFPGLLPSFNGLGPAQRAAVFFTQGKMGFNNGWLVQGEAPPGALFSKFKEVITVGGASDSDISFYFAHWLTDLAGAEPFGDRPWPGSEKFALKFPLKVLNAFLDSFNYVHTLGLYSEVQVMEDYLRGRWLSLGLQADACPEGCAVASMRLALMAQGFEHAAVAALEGLPSQDRDLLATEMARTGLQAQFASAPAEVCERPVGPALLVYYAPALIQTAGPEHVGGALLVLAAVFRAARDLFPLEATPQAVESTVVIRIDALKALTPPEVCAGGPWVLQRTSMGDAIVSRRQTSDAGDNVSDAGPAVSIIKLQGLEGLE
jgi:hypothetical protein